MGTLAFLVVTLPVWLPIWTYVRFVHRQPSRRIRKLFTAQRPDEEVLELHIDKKIGKRRWGRIKSRTGEQLSFDYHCELDLQTLYDPDSAG